MPLFHQRLINNLTEKPLEIPKAHAEVLSRWAKSIEGQTIYKVKETSLRSDFTQQILANILGYDTFSCEGPSYSLAEEYQLGSGSVDVAFGFFDKADRNRDIVLAPFELKGARTRDLDAIMPGRNKTPVQQAWEYGMDAKGAKWVLVSNYTEIRLYAIGYGRKDYELFELSKLIDPAEYTRFYSLLSKEKLLSGITLELLKKSDQVEKDITKQLYRDYKDIRARMIESIGKENPKIPGLDVVRYTQTILDRILFIAFAEDKGLLPEHTLEKAFEAKNPYSPQPIWQNFKGLFQAINEGDTSLKIPGYNGGLFAEHAELDNLSVPDELCEGFKAIGEYDFDSDVSVNILGHIFEQSISDLEEIKAHIEGIELEEAKKKSKRKKDGIFYTPSYITQYIVEQAVGGWLEDRKKEIGFEKLPVLSDEDYIPLKQITQGKNKGLIIYKKKVEEHIEAWEAYREALSNIKVLDPACGSGAFLNEVFDYLHREGQAVNRELARLKLSQTDLFRRWDTHILANNLFGVDLNQESVEITKLSLWLKTADRNEKLTYLDDNIKCGNSLVDDPNIAEEVAFSWEHEFPDIMKRGGFDVIVGNPPYGASISTKELFYIEKQFRSYEYQVNTYVLFYEKAMQLLKDKGLLGFITPATFTYQHYFKKIRALISSFGLRSIAKYNYAVFDDADIGDTVSLVIQKREQEDKSVPVLICQNRLDATKDPILVSHSNLIGSDGIFKLTSNGLMARVSNNKRLEDAVQIIVVGIKAYQTGKGIPKQTPDIVKNKPFTANNKIDDTYRLCIVGSDFHRYRFIRKPSMYLKYGEWLAEPRPEAPFYDAEKIIIRQTSDSLICHLDEEKSVNLNNVYNVGKPADGFSLKYILALLNSRLMNAVYQEIAQEKGKLFAEVKKVYLKKLPVKQISFKDQEPFTEFLTPPKK
jgi:adenine-specific DNA methylase